MDQRYQRERRCGDHQRIGQRSFFSELAHHHGQQHTRDERGSGKRAQNETDRGSREADVVSIKGQVELEQIESRHDDRARDENAPQIRQMEKIRHATPSFDLAEPVPRGNFLASTASPNNDEEPKRPSHKYVDT